jgi:uncharacterized protein (TIGR03435 family)
MACRWYLGVIRLSAILLAFGSVSQAQSPLPRFDAESVKPNRSGSPSSSMNIPPGGTFTATNVTLERLIPNAFRVLPFQVTGGPSWLASERFDIVARPPADVAADRLPEMLQAMLADRFGMKAHREMREQPIYALVVVETGGRLGPKLVRSVNDCDAVEAEKRVTTECVGTIGIGARGGMLMLKGRPLSRLAGTLGGVVGRVVVDETGRPGNYDLELRWSAGDTTASSDDPTVFTAVQEQLGLRLRSSTGRVEMLVIDAIDRPVAD